MWRFLLRRTALGLLALWLVVTLVFLLFFATPRDPARLIAGHQATAQTVAAVRHNLYLDRPLLQRYAHFWDLLVHGSLVSYRNNEKVTNLIVRALPVDISLALGAAVLWMVAGLTIGVISARWPRRFIDRASTVLALVFFSLPTFVVGLFFLYLLFYVPRVHGVKLFPPPGYVPLSQGALPWAHALVLPWVALALSNIALYSRLTRTSLLEILSKDYIKTARAKGLSERRVVLRHGLRAALTPIVTQFGIDIATVVSGVVLVEQVFGLNGVGKLALSSITTQDLPTLIGTVVLASALIITANIVVDALYAALDPSVRLN